MLETNCKHGFIRCVIHGGRESASLFVFVHGAMQEKDGSVVLVINNTSEEVVPGWSRVRDWAPHKVWPTFKVHPTVGSPNRLLDKRPKLQFPRPGNSNTACCCRASAKTPGTFSHRYPMMG